MELPGDLEACIEKFWADNPELKRKILKDWYAGGYVSIVSNLAGLKAVSEWLDAAPVPNGDR